MLREREREREREGARKRAVGSSREVRKWQYCTGLLNLDINIPLVYVVLCVFLHVGTSLPPSFRKEEFSRYLMYFQEAKIMPILEERQ